MKFGRNGSGMLITPEAAKAAQEEVAIHQDCGRHKRGFHKKKTPWARLPDNRPGRTAKGWIFL